MAVISAAEARANLLSKGFRQREGKKHTFFDLYLDGRDAGISTHFSRGKQQHSEIDDGMMDLMKPQLRLDRKGEVFELLNCTMTEEQYVAFLRDRGRLQPPPPV